MVLQLISCSPRRDQSLLVTVAPKKRELPENLTPAIGASGPHDFAVRLTRCSSKAHRRPSLPAPTSVTMANAPSLGTGWPQYATDLGQESRRISENQKYCVKREGGGQAQIKLNRFNKFDFACIGFAAARPVSL